MFICFDRIHEPDGHRHTQTDTETPHDVRHRPRLCIASRGKNSIIQVSWQKTNIQNLGVDAKTTTVSVGDQSVSGVDEFTYLGSVQFRTCRCQLDESA